MYCWGFAVYHLIECEVSFLHLCYIVGVFSQRYQFWPVILLVIGVFAQILLQFLICALRFSVRFWVIRCSYAMVDLIFRYC